MLDTIRDFFENSSIMTRLIFSFSLVLLLPRLFEKIKLPGVLALIFAGTLFGPNGFHLFKTNGEVLIIFSSIGKLLLLFFSGLDIEMDVLKKNLKKSIRLAILSFTLPALSGIIIGLIFGYPLMTALMIGVLFSSHSIIVYPILSKLGLTKSEPVSVTIGATAITDIFSLVFFAICLPIHASGFSFGPFMLQLFFIVGFIPAIIFGLKWLGHIAFKNLGEDPSQQMIFLLVVIGISAGSAELVNIEPIVGAFLAGLAVSTTLPNASVRIQLDTLGNVLFIPAFFISLGVLIDPLIIIKTIREHLWLVVSIIVSIFATKFLAAWLTGIKFGYTKIQRIFVGSLMTPQVSSTLAVALVAYETMNGLGERLIDEAILNSILVLMVVSSFVGSITTEQVGIRMVENSKK